MTNIVDAVKTGTFMGSKLMQMSHDSGHYRFYTYNFSNHDHAYTRFNNDLIRVGYQGIFAPVIPSWYMGEEIGTEVKNATLYYGVEELDYSLLDDADNRYFYERLKQYIRIRRTYTDIFEDFNIDAQKNNICEVEVAGMENYVAYARYDGEGNAIIIVPNANVSVKNATFSIKIPFEEAGLDGYKKYTVTDLINNKQLVSGTAAEAGIFTSKITNGELGVFLVSAADQKTATEQVTHKDVTVYKDVTETIEGEVTIIEEPVVGTRTETSTNYITEADYLSTGVIVAIVGSAVACVAALTALTIYIIRRRKRRIEA